MSHCLEPSQGRSYIAALLKNPGYATGAYWCSRDHWYDGRGRTTSLGYTIMDTQSIAIISSNIAYFVILI